jgi:predicted nucleic acid-binding protein
MERYADTPMALADASLVVLAEERDLKTILTLDHHFHSYRIRRGRALRSFEIIPK